MPVGMARVRATTLPLVMLVALLPICDAAAEASTRSGVLVGPVEGPAVIASGLGRIALSLAPGGRVSVGYRPRSGDRHRVDGAWPVPLPAGSRSGAELGRLAPGARWIGAATGTTDAAGTVPAGRGAGAANLDAARARPADVFGYLPYWSVGDAGVHLHLSLLSTLAFFGVAASADGRLVTTRSDGTPNTRWQAWTSAAMTSLIEHAHATGTRVVLTVQRFAWHPREEAETRRLLSDPVSRDRLATQIAAAVRERGVDGADLDFEPIPVDQRYDYVALMREVRAALDARAPGYQLTFDATRQEWLAGYDLGALTAPGAADAVFLMGYEYRGQRSAAAGAVAPLQRAPEPTPTSGLLPSSSPGPSQGGSVASASNPETDPSSDALPPPSGQATPTPPPPDQTDDLRSTLAAYLAQTSAEHIILGLPFYGRVWSTVDGSVRALTLADPPRYGRSLPVIYASAAIIAATHGRRYDGLEASAWTTYRYHPCPACPVVTRELYYDDARSLGTKVDLVPALGLRGVGIWALGYDGSRPELAAALTHHLGLGGGQR